MTPARCLSILLVEDSEEDYYTITRAWRELDLPVGVSRCESVDEAVTFLKNRGLQGSHHTLPDIVLLDLNLPGRGGNELFDEMKSVPELAFIPIVVLTTSVYPGDVDYCYRAGASGYIQKSANLEEFYDALRSLHAYWSKTVVLPQRNL